jgi:cell division protein FtsB
VVLLIVLVVVAALYIQQALAYVAVRGQADRQRALALELERQNANLASEQRALNNPATIQLDARKLGMVRAGERPYVITGLSGR